jgi:hypothetical protein
MTSPPSDALFEQRAARRQQHRNADLAAGLGRIERPELHPEIVRARVAVAGELLGERVEVLLRVADRLLERRRCRLVDDAHATARALRDLDGIEADVLAGAAEADRPSMPGGQGIVADGTL